MSVDVEGSIYRQARALGITLLTVSHRKSLWAHHDALLLFDGQGGYTFRQIQQGDADALGS